MKESHVEGLAAHNGPESCGVARKGVGEALTGVRAGRVFSRERTIAPRRRRRKGVRKATLGVPPSQGTSGPRAVVDPVHARKHLAREPGGPAFARPRQRGRPHREVFGHTPMMHERRKSDGPVVPAKPPNNGGGPRLDPGRPKPSPAEGAEGRGPATGNRRANRIRRTQCRSDGCSRFSRRYAGEHVILVMSCFIPRHYPRQEPDAGNPPVRIRAGGGPKGPSLPRCFFAAFLKEQAPRGRLIFRERQGVPEGLDGMATGEPWGNTLLLVTRGACPGPGGATDL